MPYNELRQKDVPKIGYLVENLIPEIGITMLQGHPGSYKTWFADYLAFCVTHGKPVFGNLATKKTKVLLVCLDDYLVVTKERLAKIGLADEAPVFVWDPEVDLVLSEENDPKTNSDGMIAKMIEYIKANDIGLVIIDTFRDIHRKDENKAEEILPIMNILKQLAFSSSVVLLHHLNKNQASAHVVASRGSTVIPATLIAALDFRFDRTNNVIKITPFKNKIGKMLDTIPVRFNENANGEGVLTRIAANEATMLIASDVENAIREFYNENPEPDLTQPAFIADLHERTPAYSKNAIKTAFKHLVDKGYLRPDGVTRQANKRVYTKNPDYQEAEEQTA